MEHDPFRKRYPLFGIMLRLEFEHGAALPLQLCVQRVLVRRRVGEKVNLIDRALLATRFAMARAQVSDGSPDEPGRDLLDGQSAIAGANHREKDGCALGSAAQPAPEPTPRALVGAVRLAEDVVDAELQVIWIGPEPDRYGGAGRESCGEVQRQSCALDGRDVEDLVDAMRRLQRA